MRLLQVETAGVRGLPDAAFTFVPERGGPGHLTVVTGPPRAGLTSLLTAIVLASGRLAVSGRRPDPHDLLRSGGATAMIRARLWLDADERAYGGVTDEVLGAEVVFQREGLGRAEADPALLGLLSRYDHTDRISKILWFPAARVHDGGGPRMEDFEADQRFLRLSSSADKYAGVPAALVRCHGSQADRARFDTAARLFGELCGKTKLVGVDDVGLSFETPAGLRVSQSALSFSERNALVFSAIVALAGVSRSILLVDTPELGLAPGAAARWLDVLREAAPEAQWIVATRDPAIVSGAPPDTVVTLRAPGEAR